VLVTTTIPEVSDNDTVVAVPATGLDDGLGPAIGLAAAVVLSAPLWVAMFLVVRSLLG
jgi:hypothetical protein